MITIDTAEISAEPVAGESHAILNIRDVFTRQHLSLPVTRADWDELDEMMRRLFIDRRKRR